MTAAQKRSLKPHCTEIRRFAFERFPRYFAIRRAAGQYAWKPVIIDEVAAQFGGSVLWLDAGDLVYGSLGAVKRLLGKEGFYSPTSAGDIRKWTHPRTLAQLGAKSWLLKKRNRSGAIVGFNTALAGPRALLTQWKDCALEKRCIAPPGSSRKNHRQDQAVLSVLTYQLQRQYEFALVDELLDIATHQDAIAPAMVDKMLWFLKQAAKKR